MRARPVPDIAAFVATAEKKSAPFAASTASAASARKRRSADEGAMKSLLAGTPIDTAAFDAAARARTEARKADAGETRRRAIAGSEKAAARIAGLSVVPAVGPAPADPWQPGSFILDTASYLRAWPDNAAMRDYRVGPQENWAEYRLEDSAGSVSAGPSPVARMSFYTLWRNPRKQDIVANVGARVNINAHISVDAEWNGVAAWFIGGSSAQAGVRARITLWPLWTQGSVIIAEQPIASVAASGGFFGDDNDTSIIFSQFLTGGAYFVPKEAYLLIEVSVVTEYSLTNGSIDFDGQSGGFRLACPYTIVTIPSGASMMS